MRTVHPSRKAAIAATVYSRTCNLFTVLDTLSRAAGFQAGL